MKTFDYNGKNITISLKLDGTDLYVKVIKINPFKESGDFCVNGRLYFDHCELKFGHLQLPHAGLVSAIFPDVSESVFKYFCEAIRYFDQSKPKQNNSKIRLVK